ncbi:hypothetical protein FRC08_010719 [Ceratobasidium sp. 394]|nr:hypothetical protein FRC08_010719 [Ceratobasidium sp. 394]
MHEQSTLIWTVPSLLFAKRLVRQLVDAADKAVSQGALYYAAAENRVRRAARYTPEVEQLWRRAIDWEDANVSEAPESLGREIRELHPVINEIIDNAALFDESSSAIPFPSVWVMRDVCGQASWSTSALLDCLFELPYCDPATKLPMTGRFGLCIWFYTILHYVLNVADNMPATEEERDARIAQGIHVYGVQDFRDLAFCAALVMQSIPDLAAAPHQPTYCADGKL